MTDRLLVFSENITEQMAQISFGQSDLRKALLRVPKHAAGARNIADILKINLENMLPNSFNYFEKVVPAFTKCLISCIAEDIDKQLLELLMKYFNTNPPFQFDEALLSGSWSEGLTMHQVLNTSELSDMDFMCILKNISFSAEDQACGNLEVKEHTPFVNACITNPELLKMWGKFLEDPNEDTTRSQLSARKLKAMLHENYKKRGMFLHGDSEKCKTIGDGPSLELKGELPKFNSEDIFQDTSHLLDIIRYKIVASNDIILTIRCDGWPHCAWEWLLRDRLWPDKILVQRICQEGFHIVPKSSPEGNFRLSFSNAETTLIENFTPLQHKVIRAFKAVIKYHQSNWSHNIKDIICTYHLKTIAFWHIEKTTQDSWTEDNVVSHLLSLIEEFAQALRKRNLPMYFLPKYNLLENVENVEEMKKISDKVAELSNDIPAIITAISRVANTKLGDAIITEMNRNLLRNIWDNEFNGFQELMKLPEFEMPKEMTFISNILDNILSISKKENETFINLD